MCGIDVTVVVTRRNDGGAHYSHDAITSTATTRPENEWLRRRGPDACGTAVVMHDDDDECGTTTTVVTLQASVLQMRDALIPQPVPIVVAGAAATAATDTDVNNDDTTTNTTTVVWHLAWNGEVYQRQCDTGESDGPANATTVPQLEDVDSHAIADTQLVADMIRHAVTGETASREEEDDSTTIPTIAQQLAHSVFARLVNAEFAFALVTPTCVYYGRDVLGRRSLLVGSTTVSSSSMSKEEDSSTPTPTMQWQLASVAMTTADTTASTTTTWTEVEPGMVHSYEWSTGRHTHVAWDVPPLPSNSTTTPTTTVENNSIPPSLGRTLETQPQPQQEGATTIYYDPMELGEDASVVVQLQALLLAAVRRRCTTNATMAVLFSGGLDSVVLACLALQCCTSLTLLTVSFVDDKDNNNSTNPATPAAADTVAAYQSYHELKELYPAADIRFVHRTVDWHEVAEIEPRIRALAHPKTTVMDLNIATALWFAASAADDNVADPDNTTSNPRPRVLLSGLGADELLGGYGRHRTAWERGGDTALRAELDLDVNRLWDRNLGRDDRVLSDHSKEVRFPFLDAAVVQFVRQLPLDGCIVDYRLEPGVGDKRILRLVAARLGLVTAASAVKRAIQFGSRIAHVSDKRRFGSRRKATGVAEASSSNNNNKPQTNGNNTDP